MTDTPEPSAIRRAVPSESGYSNYTYNPVTLHNTIGLACMAFVALALLIALVREHARYRELALWVARGRE